MLRHIIPLAVFATPAIADPDYGHMHGGVGMIFGPVLWLVVLGLVVVGVFWLVRRLDDRPSQGRSSGALAELDMRFARGEIDAEEYAARKKLLAS